MRSESLRTASWTVAYVLVTSWVTLQWLAAPPASRFEVAAGPFDGTSAVHARRWRFIQQVDEILPRGVTYTFRASTPAEESDLHMLAASVLEDRTGVPSTYAGVTHDNDAPWILSFECSVVPPDTNVVAVLPDGCICERLE